MVIRFLDLCLDAVDARRAADFWAPALGLTAEPVDDKFLLTDGDDAHRLWINPVPEPKTVKQRVHFDLHVAAVSDLTALGATVLNDTQPWTDLADPEGGELCAFVREPERLPDYRLYEVVVDSADPVAIAGWWAEQFGVPAQHDQDEGFSWLAEAPGRPWEMIFTRVPEPKTVKNRIHWDVRGDVAPLVAAGARVLREPGGDIHWTVMADPEGNEFCVFDD